MIKPHLALITPATEIRTLARRSTPRRPTNAALRTREHLAQHEVEKLIEVVKRNRHGRRDALMIFLVYRHGLRAAEVVDLRWEQVDCRTATLHADAGVAHAFPDRSEDDWPTCRS
jgi:integrase